MRVVACGIAILIALAQASESTDAAAVIETLLFGLEMAPATRTAGLPADAQQRLARYRQREKGFTSTIPRPPDLDGPLGSLYWKRVGIERAIFSLMDRPDGLAIAESVATSIHFQYEWEGFAGSPLTEAAAADAFLEEHSASPAAAYVQLFAGHRRLCAASGFQGLDPQSQEGRRVAGEAERHLSIARDSGDPILRVVAE